MVIDGSQMGNAHVALMVSMVYKNRSIPINWLVKKGGKGHFTTQMHIDLIQQVYQQFKTLLPKDKSLTWGMENLILLKFSSFAVKMAGTMS